MAFEAETAAGAAFVHRLRVGWAHCDPAGIAYTGAIPGFALEAIDAWWERHVGLDWYRLNFERKIGTPFVHLCLDFAAPVTPRHPLDCEVRLTRIGETSVGFSVLGLQSGVKYFKGEFVCVFVQAGAMRKIPAPPDIRALIAPLLAAPG